MPKRSNRAKVRPTKTSVEAVAREAPHVRVLCCRPDVDGCQPVEPERISDLLPTEGALFWVDVENPGPPELEMLREEFGFHWLALEDAAKHLYRPKVDEYPGYFFVVMYAALPMAGEAMHTREVDLFIGRNYVVSLHRGPVPALQTAMQRWERADPDLRGKAGFLLYTILDELIDAYFPIVDEVEDRLDRLELSLFGGRGRANPRNLLTIKRALFALRKAVYPLRETFNLFLRREQTIFGEETLPYFQDVYDHVLRLLDTVDIQRDMVTGTLDAYLSVISNRLNETMQRLTVVAIVVAVMGAVFGAWGMNFDRIPLSHSPFGFWALLGGTLALVAAVLVWARQKRLW